MSNGPPPSRLCFLSDLPSKSKGDKVRFLGCVSSYATAEGIVVLQHECPRASRIQALVNVDLILENLTSEQLQVGEWVNVIGYVTSVSSSHETTGVHVQALLLWSAGPLHVQNYERQLTDLIGVKTGTAGSTGSSMPEA